MESVNDMYCKQRVVEFPVAEKETEINIKKRDICAPVVFYAAYSGNSLQTFRDNPSVPF
jgi:hypothetical protein